MDLQTYGGPVLKLPWKEAAGFVRAAELRLYVKKAAPLLPPFFASVSLCVSLVFCFTIQGSFLLSQNKQTDGFLLPSHYGDD